LTCAGFDCEDGGVAADAQVRRAEPRAGSDEPRPFEEDRSELAGLIAAGVMTFLLSGDLLLATRATRLLLRDGSPAVEDAACRSRTWRSWRQR
jgi:hypothetical protein